MKKKKRSGRVFLIILILLAAFILFLYINGTCRYSGQTADISASSWMSGIADDTPVNKVVIPGSHDAGTAGIIWLGRTQNYDIATQLSFGARYFDIRVNKTDSGYPIYHSFMNGTDFTEVLSQIRAFIKANPTEVIFLDFQHFKGGSQDDVYAMLKTALDDEGLLVKNDTDIPDAEFIRNLTVGEARGKCIVFFGETEEDFSDFVFLRNDDGCTKDGMSLDSYYIGSCHKGGFDTLVNEGHPVYFELLEKKQSENKDAVFVLQCQLTDGKLIFGPWSVERAQEKDMDEYVLNLKNSPDFDGVNVILRDFLTPDKCADIIELNSAKGIMS